MKKNRITGIIWAGAASALIILLTLMSKDVSAGIRSSIEICQGIVIPSLFPMIFAAVFLAESGAAATIGRVLAPAARFLFGLPGEAGAAVLMAMLGGYPTGASMIASLRERGAITGRQASRMALFCVSAGPAFLVSAVGASLLGSVNLGLLLAGIQILCVIILGIILNIYDSCFDKRNLSDERTTRIGLKAEDASLEHPAFAEAVVKSAWKAASSMLMICVFVLLFGAVKAVLSGLGVMDMTEGALTRAGLSGHTAASLLPMMLEVVGGCIAAARGGIILLAFGIGFGGVAVHFQVFALLKNITFSKPAFFGFRALHGGLSALLAWLLLPLVPDPAIPAAAMSGSRQLALPSATGAVLLLVLCLMFVLCLPNKSSPRPAPGFIEKRLLRRDFARRLKSSQ